METHPLGENKAEPGRLGGIRVEESRPCPGCHGRMDAGTLGFFTLLGGAYWFKERTTLMLGGESIVKNPLGGDPWMDGFRCPKCRMLLLDD